MTQYTTCFSPKGTRIARIKDDGISAYEYFTGYDAMGSANWSTDGTDACMMELEEAEAIQADLEAAEDIQHFSFGKLCAAIGLKPEVMQSYHGGPVPQEAYLK